MIKAVIFDMYETLITQYGGPVYFRAQMAADAGIDPVLFDALWIPSENDRTIGKQTLEETIEQILRQTGKYSKEIFQTIITGRKAAKADCFRHLHPEIIPMLQTLKEKQIKIGLISNCYSEEAVLIRESQLFSYFAQACLSYELGMKKPDPKKADNEQAAAYGAYQAYVALHGKDALKKALQEAGMWNLFEEIEMPLVFTLDDMEKEGILVKGEELKLYGEKLEVRIRELEEKIYEEAGETFNINSPKQLGVILFEKMQMPGGKKTKTGYSTAADVLDKLAPDYPFVADILEYRQLTKLKSTYADGLAGYIGEDGRIHSTFNQTITATGRISSTEPNLQNIPVSMELGRLIRKVFVPRDGFVFLDADYSQIELRVLAHLSGDEMLIKAYREAQDIHRMTASQVFHIPFDEVTPLQRRNAKAVNFGIVYGISSFGLSQDLSITRKEAADYIEKYFATYPKIKSYLDGEVEKAKADGYSLTMFGRRRPVPELKSSNFMQRSFGERIAMNSPIQGTAADIIKIAMIRVNQALRSEHLRSRLVLQVHDELLIETAKEEVEEVSAILEREMRQAADLSVPLEVDMHTGENWYEAK